MIDTLASIVIPIEDHDRSIRFYSGLLGFSVDTDFTPAPGMRWVELGLPGMSTKVALATPRGGMWRSPGGDTNISLGCTGIVDEHARLRDAGVDVDDELLDLGDSVPKMFRLRDPDGNVVQIVEAMTSSEVRNEAQ